MEWEGREESENVEDRRGISGRTAAIGGGSAAVLVIAFLISQFLNVDQKQVEEVLKKAVPPGQAEQRTIRPGPADPHEERNRKFTAIILRDTEIVWTKLFAKMGRQYVEPKLVIFSGSVDSACGRASASVGPFYCPGDEQVYIDLSFYDLLERRLNSPGDFAKAYVVAHEIGHHVQKQLGYARQSDQLRARGFEKEGSVRLELQADFLAGIWGHYANEQFKNYIQPGDVESAMNAAQNIGDDKLQAGHVRPDTFTHGTSAERQRWFFEGFRKGDLNEAKQLFDLPYERL